MHCKVQEQLRPNIQIKITPQIHLETYWVWHLGAFKFWQKGSSKSCQTTEWHVCLNSNGVSWNTSIIRSILYKVEISSDLEKTKICIQITKASFDKTKLFIASENHSPYENLQNPNDTITTTNLSVVGSGPMWAPAVPVTQ